MSLMTARLGVCFIIHEFSFLLSVSFHLSELLSLSLTKASWAARQKLIHPSIYLSIYLL